MEKPRIISLATLKGGAGKSTISIHLAAYLHQIGNKVLLVDSDPQSTTRQWAALSAVSTVDRPPVVGMGAEMRRDLVTVAEGWKYVVIDTPPRLGAEQRAAMFVSDLVLVPVTPGPADLWTLKETLALLNDVRELRPKLRAGIVLNRFDSRTALAGTIREAIETAGLPILDTVLGHRVAFGEAQISGQGVVAYSPKTPAAAEIKALAEEIEAIWGDA